MNTDKVWQDYASRNFEKFVSSLKNDDFISGEKEIISFNNVDFSGPKKTYKYLRKIITKSAIKRLQNRFRANKHRENRGIKNLQLKSHSLDMLNTFKAHVGDERRDEALDCVLSPD